jgi:hypothetical protein
LTLAETFDKPAAKALIVVVAVAAIGGAAYEATTSPAFKNNDYGKQVSPSQVTSGAQKAIEALKTNTTIPESVRKQEIEHLQAEIDSANGKVVPTSGPPTNPPKGSN